MQKNVAGQMWIVFAYEDEGGTNPGEAVTGGAAAITANLYIDGATPAATNDTNPTEMEDGYYYFNMTQAETNGDCLLLTPQSSTANVNVIACPPVIYTTPPFINSAVYQGTAVTGTLTTTSFSTNLQSAYSFSTDDALNNASIIFLGDVTAALKGQRGVISDYAQSNGVVTISTALTTAPANGDGFIIV